MNTLEPEPMQTPDTYRTAVLDRQEIEQPVEPGDHERFAHYVQKEKILESAMTGAPVIALCGKVWVPGRDPQKFPVCPLCKEIFEGLAPGDNKAGRGGGRGGNQGSGSD
ncbi:MAG TPA: DUF3039 domain-containing protein [Kineosporiaceae bacterium]|jgi:hypothetical protein|nr:DUF3039 domain-containing protein [Kineosporiaceae bacterium]